MSEAVLTTEGRKLSADLEHGVRFAKSCREPHLLMFVGIRSMETLWSAAHGRPFG
jgi:hypothetical protein